MTSDAGPPVRIAFVVGSASGGTAGHVSSLAVGCRDAGAEVTVFGPAAMLAGLGMGRDAVPVEIGERARPARAAAAVGRLRAGFGACHPAVVHAHGVRAGALAALAIATLPGQSEAGAARRGKAGARKGAGKADAGRSGAKVRSALAVTVHNAPPASGATRIFYGILERICARRADIVLCASADLVTRMRARGANAEQFDVPAPVRPAPTPADVAAARAELGAGGRSVVLAVARLAPQKGLDLLINAAARWRDREPRPLTVIAGSGPLAADLRAQASQANADVVLLGAREDVPALLAVADVVVVPSRWEARALIIQEAMRSGRPVVATKVGGTPELTGPDAAILVPPEDPVALADAVAAVLDDAALADQLSTAALRRSATFGSQQDAVRAALDIYQHLIQRQAPGRRGPVSI